MIDLNTIYDITKRCFEGREAKAWSIEMRILFTASLILLCSTLVYAEEYRGTYSWIGEKQKHKITIVVDAAKAIDKGDFLNIDYVVVENSEDELLLMKKFTKRNSGKGYPVGFALIVLDKKTGAFVRSNTFAGGDQNNHALGRMIQVVK